jgi:hypothetical protein
MPSSSRRLLRGLTLTLGAASVVAGCGTADVDGSTVPATSGGEPTAATEPAAPAPAAAAATPPPAPPAAPADEHGAWRTCASDDDCVAVPAVCGAWDVANRASEPAMRAHYDELGSRVRCDGSEDPAPTPVCRDGQCAAR